MKASMAADNDAEKEAREALNFEDKVDFARAKEAWQKVLESNEVGTPEGRSLGLVAERHLRDLAKSEADEKALQEKIQLDMTADKFAIAVEEPKFSATRALRFEGVGDFGKALELWQKVAAGLDKELMRSWNYLAMRKQKELNQKIEKLENKEPLPQRLAALDAYLSQVEFLADQRPAVALTACKNVLDLYSKDKDPDVAQRLTKFENLAKNITKKGHGS
jgi:hypothetical protein